MKKILLLFIIGIYIIQPKVFGQNHLFVDPKPIAGNNHFTEIQAAVDAAVDGDIIQINSGTYTETVTISRILS